MIRVLVVATLSTLLLAGALAIVYFASAGSPASSGLSQPKALWAIDQVVAHPWWAKKPSLLTVEALARQVTDKRACGIIHVDDSGEVATSDGIRLPLSRGIGRRCLRLSAQPGHPPEEVYTTMLRGMDRQMSQRQ